MLAPSSLGTGFFPAPESCRYTEPERRQCLLPVPWEQASSVPLELPMREGVGDALWSMRTIRSVRG